MNANFFLLKNHLDREVERESVLALSLTSSLSLKHIDLFYKCYGSYEVVLNLKSKEFQKIKLMKSKKYFEGRDVLLSKAEKVKQACKRLKIRWVTISDVCYPRSLRESYLPPLVLYYKSEQDLPKYYLGGDASYLAIVGTRKSDLFMEHFSQKIANSFVEKGGHIISGLAWGIDRFAHIGACLNNQASKVIDSKKGSQIDDRLGSTTAVMACGVDYIYPYANREVYKAILNTGGVVMSEQPPGVKPLPYLFPLRNRVISGLSEGIFVAQAPSKSGALITVQYALEQGRTIYTFDPRSLSVVTDPYLGNLKLIEDGAIPVEKEEDLFNELGWLNKQYFNPKNSLKPILLDKLVCAQKNKSKSKNEKGGDEFNLEAYFLEILRTPKNISELSQGLELNVMELNRLIMDQLIQGKIKELPGKRYFSI